MKFKFKEITLSLIAAYSISPFSALAQANLPSNLSASVTLSYDYSLPGLGIQASGNGPINKTIDFPSAAIPTYGTLPSLRILNDGVDMADIAVAGGNTVTYNTITEQNDAVVTPFTDAHSTTSFHAVYTNTGSVSNTFNFNFNIGGGSLYVNQFDSGSASFYGKILVNNVEVWSSSATLSKLILSTQGVDLGFQQDSSNPFDNPSYYFNAYNGVINLGVLNPNESVDVQYILSANANTQGSENYGGAIARIDDPFGVEGMSVSLASPVSEPSSLALMVAGAGLLASRVRNRKKQA